MKKRHVQRRVCARQFLAKYQKTKEAERNTSASGFLLQILVKRQGNLIKYHGHDSLHISGVANTGYDARQKLLEKTPKYEYKTRIAELERLGPASATQRW